MSDTYVHTDDTGARLVISPCDDSDLNPGHVHLTGAGVDVAPSDLPAIAAALYAAAGKPEPVILDRPSVPQDGAPLRYGNFGMRLHKDGIAFSLPGVEVEAIPPDAALELAAHIAAYAAEATRNEPDPDEVSGLADAIHCTYCDSADCTLSPTLRDRDSARAALRWMRDKQQGAAS